MDDRSSLFRTPVGSFPSLDDDDDDEDALLRNSNHPTTTLTAKPYAFAGAVLSPKHARDLTPSNCLQIAHALAEQSHRRTVVPYTLWITEAWRVRGWAEPSAALFWELATMYHTLYLAGRAYAADYHEHGGGSLMGHGPNAIPPILSCGSASSVGSGTTTHTPVTFDKKKFSTAASAKELPVWLVGTFLLLHCEEFAFWRNLSGKDERRFYDGGVSRDGSSDSSLAGAGEQVNFVSLLRHPSLSPR
jgi:TBCC domain-containing protein 1